MRSEVIRDLADCTEFRQTLEARPPRFVRGSIVLLAVLLGAAVVWAALTEVDLVVRAPGRVRPVESPTKAFAAGGEGAGAGFGGRVVEVNFRVGDQVRRGDVLIRLDTERLDHEIAKCERAARAAEDELADLRRLARSAKRQYEAARAKAEAELAQALGEVARAGERRAVDVRLAQEELESAADEERRLRELVARRAAAESDLVRASSRLREAGEKLHRARLPVEDGRVAVLRRALALTERDDAVRRDELAMKQAAKRAEIDTARIELAGLRLGREQSVIRAPQDGVVTAGEVRVGDVLERGRPVGEIAAQAGFRFEAQVPSDEVADLRAGMPARVRLDAFDPQRFGAAAGSVCFIAPDTGAPEANRPATYLVRVEMDGDVIGPGGFRARARLGMTGQVEVVTGRESLLALLLQRVRRTVSFG
jgi:multidrug resistance efflux pump